MNRELRTWLYGIIAVVLCVIVPFRVSWKSKDAGGDSSVGYRLLFIQPSPAEAMRSIQSELPAGISINRFRPRRYYEMLRDSIVLLSAESTPPLVTENEAFYDLATYHAMQAIRRYHEILQRDSTGWLPTEPKPPSPPPPPTETARNQGTNDSDYDAYLAKLFPKSSPAFSHVSKNAPPITDADIEAYLNTSPADIRREEDSAHPERKKYLEELEKRIAADSVELEMRIADDSIAFVKNRLADEEVKAFSNMSGNLHAVVSLDVSRFIPQIILIILFGVIIFRGKIPKDENEK